MYISIPYCQCWYGDTIISSIIYLYFFNYMSIVLPLILSNFLLIWYQYYRVEWHWSVCVISISWDNHENPPSPSVIHTSTQVKETIHLHHDAGKNSPITFDFDIKQSFKILSLSFSIFPSYNCHYSTPMTLNFTHIHLLHKMFTLRSLKMTRVPHYQRAMDNGSIIASPTSLSTSLRGANTLGAEPLPSRFMCIQGTTFSIMNVCKFVCNIFSVVCFCLLCVWFTTH